MYSNSLLLKLHSSKRLYTFVWRYQYRSYLQFTDNIGETHAIFVISYKRTLLILIWIFAETFLFYCTTICCYGNCFWQTVFVYIIKKNVGGNYWQSATWPEGKNAVMLVFLQCTSDFWTKFCLLLIHLVFYLITVILHSPRKSEIFQCSGNF